MTDPECLFFYPAYWPQNTEQADLFQKSCVTLAEELQFEACFNEGQILEYGVGKWCSGSKTVDVRKLFNYNYLWPIRGGFGSVNWLGSLDVFEKAAAPCLIGYSDISAWHAYWWHKQWGESYYAFMPGTSWSNDAKSSLKTCLAGTEWVLSHEQYGQVNALHDGSAEGPCFASCLRVLCSLIGTPYMPKLDGCILALEDIDERPYSIERDMQQLFLAGALDEIQGLVIGTMPCELPEHYAGPSIQDLFKQWGQRLGIPVIQALAFGHETDPLSLPIGRMSHLTVRAEQWSWSFEQR